MIKKTARFLIPVFVIGVAQVLAFLDYFSSPTIACGTLIAIIAITLLWRRWIFTKLSTDYEARFETATDAVRLNATRWTAIIYGMTYSVSIFACGLGYLRAGSWTTFALIILTIGMIAKIPWSLLAIDWELHRVED